MRSVRVRLTLLYSVAVFGVTALVLLGIYVGLAHRLKPAPRFQPAVYRVIPEGQTGLPFKQVIVSSATGTPDDDIRNVERRHTLDELRRLTFAALGGLFLLSLAIGYVVAGRVLRPVDALLDSLEASLTAQRQFVADASHELRNPLAVIRTNADVALREPLGDDVRTRLEAVRRASERMRRLVDDLLALARLELAGGQRAEVDLATVVDEVRGELDALARAHGLPLEARAECDLRVVADRDAVKRALANLLDNAFRHSPDGAPVRVAAERRNGWAVLSVADRGPGLTAEEQERVFERFWRSDASRSRESGGAGLGLAIVRRIAESHGGEVAVTSQPGAGATFELRLPAA
jgi:signal transduction histidine kinase